MAQAMRIPPAAEAAKASASGAFCLEPLRRLAGELRQHRRWLPQVWHYALASMVDMFALSTFAPGPALALAQPMPPAAGYVWGQGPKAV